MEAVEAGAAIVKSLAKPVVLAASPLEAPAVAAAESANPLRFLKGLTQPRIFDGLKAFANPNTRFGIGGQIIGEQDEQEKTRKPFFGKGHDKSAPPRTPQEQEKQGLQGVDKNVENTQSADINKLMRQNEQLKSELQQARGEIGRARAEILDLKVLTTDQKTEILNRITNAALFKEARDIKRHDELLAAIHETKT